jgi:hypothetical protein
MNSKVLDIVERTVATGAFAFLSVFSISDLSTAKDAGIAGAAAALSVVKGLLKNYLGLKGDEPTPGA